MNDNIYPEVLEIVIERQTGYSYSLVWESGSLKYSRGYGCINETSIVEKPSSAKWKRFWDELKNLGVWNWERKYQSEKLFYDGTKWYVKIKFDSYGLECEGENAFPPNGEYQVSKDFIKFCEAISLLCGGRKLR